MASFVLIFICITAGLLLRRYGLVPPQAHKGINAWIIYLALPAVSLKYLPALQFDTGMLFSVSGPVMVWIGAWLFVQLISYKRQWSKPTKGALILCTGLCNTSFVGFPLVTAYFGEEALKHAVVCDQVTFLLLSTIGLVMTVRHSHTQQIQAGVLLKKILAFPPLWGCILALTLPHWFSLAPLEMVFDKLAATVGPLALFSIGLQLKFTGWKDEWKHLLLVTVYKLLLAPLWVYAAYLLFTQQQVSARVTVFEMAMPTLLTASVIAEEYHLHTRLVNLCVGVTIVLSFVTTAIWYLIIG